MWWSRRFPPAILRRPQVRSGEGAQGVLEEGTLAERNGEAACSAAFSVPKRGLCGKMRENMG